MSKLLPGLAIGLSLAVFPLAAVVIPASAKDQVVTVTIAGEFADALSAATGIPVADLPASLDVPRGIANNVCGVKVGAGETCAATAKATLLGDFLLDDDSSAVGDDDDSSVPSDDESSSSSSVEEHDNTSAKAFAPGQLKGDDESAKDYAPGHNKGDSGNASHQAPGHQKGGNGGGKK